MNRIEWTAKATKQLLKIKQISLRQRLYSEAQVLNDFPNCSNVKALKGHAVGYRLRVGDWRILFNFDGTVNIVSIEEVRKRDERTY